MTKQKPEVAFVSLVPIAIQKGVKIAVQHENKDIRGTIVGPPFEYWRVAQ